MVGKRAFAINRKLREEVEGKKHAKYKLIQGDCRRTKFSIAFVDHCCRWYERITLVCILSAHASPTARTHTSTHIFPLLLLLIFAFFYYDPAITLMCLFCVVDLNSHFLLQTELVVRMNVSAAKMRFDLLAKSFGTFHLKAQTTKPLFFLQIQWTDAAFFFDFTFHIIDATEFNFHPIRSVSFKLHFYLNIWSHMSVFHFNKHRTFDSSGFFACAFKQINHHVYITLLQTN